MQTIIFIIHPPVVRYTPNFEIQQYMNYLSSLSVLIEQNKAGRALTENVFLLAGDNASDVFLDAVRTLPVGMTYSHATSTEELKWRTTDKTK